MLNILPTPSTASPQRHLWLEKEDPAEVERVEEEKRKQKRLEQELREKWQRQERQQAKEQPATAH